MMLKLALMASAMTIALPAVAQQAAPQTPDATMASPSQPGDAGATPAQTTPTEQAAPAAAPANQDAQVAQVLDAEFPTYDKDQSGSLSKAEFAAWMDTLKAKADPSAKPDAAWNTAAFAKADGDKSKSVTKEELASFLTGATTSGS
jgi:hypothetical protein